MTWSGPRPGCVPPELHALGLISLVCTVLTLPAGIVAGSVLIDWLGYDPNNLEALPSGVALLAGSVTLLIILVAPLMALCSAGGPCAPVMDADSSPCCWGVSARLRSLR